MELPDGLALALATPGLGFLLGAAALAGLVYGFAGFGSALIFIPLANALVGPILAVPAFQACAVISLVTVVPKAARQADLPAVALLVGTSLLAAPLGIWWLATVPGNILQWVASGIVGGTLGLLILGWRYQVTPSRAVQALVGAGAGVMGGATGLNGPLVILFQLGGPDEAAKVRANMVMFLTLNSLFVLPLMAWNGVLTGQALWLGALLIAPYGGASLIGQALFTPARQGIYRRVAYGMIALSVVLGLPIWNGG